MESLTSIIKVADLSDADRLNMFHLHRQYYDNVLEDVFFRDLSEKDWVIMMKDEQGQVHGFSTIQLISLRVLEADHLFLFSGDTVMSEHIRNTPALASAFLQFSVTLIENYPGMPIYWFLISKGYRTYRFLQLYFNEYYPVHNKVIPEYYQKILDAVAFYKFGDQYYPREHLIRHKTISDRLKPEHATIAEGRQKNPVVKFFLAKNPDFYKGDDLACITAISVENFSPLVERVRQSTRVQFEWKQ